MNPWLAFIAGAIIGATLGVFAAAICIAGGEEDARLERLHDRRP